MICVEKIGMVRRFYFVEKKSIKEICRLLEISRGTVRKIVRSGATEFKYVRKSQPYPKLGPWRKRLEKILEENEALPKKQRRRMTRIWKELVNDGYDGGYASVCRYAKKWRIAHGKQQAQAFIPLVFDPGEAYQFDWSEEKVVIVNRHSTVTHYPRPTVTHLQEGGTGGEESEILFFSAKWKRRPSLSNSMQIIPVCLSIVARRKGVSTTRRGGSNWTPISLLVGHPCKLFHRRSCFF